MEKTRGTARQEVREALVKAATRIIANDGTKSLRARDLAAEVGCALGTIYNVFPDMDALVLAVRIETLDRLEAEVQARLGSDRPPNGSEARQRLLALAGVYIDFAHANWGLWSAAFEPMIVSGAVWDAYLERLGRIFHWIETPLAVLLGDANAAHLPLLTRALFSAVHGIVLNGLDQSLGNISLDDLKWQATTVLGAALDGLIRPDRM